MRGISAKAVVLATLAVIGIDVASGIALMSIYGEPLTNPTEEQLRAAAAALNRNPDYLRAALVLGTASTVVGGYLAARLAASVPYFNALAFGVLGVLLGAALSTEVPREFLIVGLGLTIPAALFGAYLCKRRTRAAGRSDR